MTNNTNTPLKAYQVSNSSLNDVNSSLYSTNSSFISGNINMLAKLEKNTKYPLAMMNKKTDVTGAVTHLLSFSDSKKQHFTSDDNKRYHDCTTKHSAAKPSRQPLAIFVSKTYLINTQQVTTGTNKSITSSNRYTYNTGHSDVSCDGMSETNTIPLVGNNLRDLNVVVVIPFYPFFTIYNKHTKHSGGHYHA